MNNLVFIFEPDGKPVLGFDTGLSAQAFAQAKIAAYITDPGFVVFPDGKIETWLPGGVAEQETMIIWGPSFPGEELTEIINAPDRKDEALNAIRFWLRARITLEENLRDQKDAPLPGPAGAYIAAGGKSGTYPEGTVFFPPARLLKRTLEAEKNNEEFAVSASRSRSIDDTAVDVDKMLENECWIHPDLEGAESVSFTAGAMLYKIFSNSPPFSVDDSAVPDPSRKAGRKDSLSSQDELRQNIREAVFVPPRLAAPGLDPEMCGVISRAMSRVPQNKEEKNRPAPDFILGLLCSRPSKTFSSWLKPPGGEELSRIRSEQEQHNKKTALAVKTRRFVIRNTAIITGILIGVVVLLLTVRGFIRHRAELPTTEGLSPVEVAETYYNAFGTLDHTLMEACVMHNAGKRDIEMVINLFVISRMRQAYEATGSFSMSAEEWIAGGRPATDKTVFGITDLKINVLSESDTNVILDTDYILWMPGAYLADENDVSRAAETPNPGEEEEFVPLPPGGLASRDRLSLVFENDLWRIAEIERESNILK